MGFLLWDANWRCDQGPQTPQPPQPPPQPPLPKEGRMMCLPAALPVFIVCARAGQGQSWGSSCKWSPLYVPGAASGSSYEGGSATSSLGGGRCFRTEVTEGNSVGFPEGVPSVFVRSSRFNLATLYKKEPLICAITFRDNVCCCLCTSLMHDRL